MTKYNSEQLKEMADQFLEAEKQQDIRCLQLTMAVGMMTNMHPEEVRARIIGLAGVDVKV